MENRINRKNQKEIYWENPILKVTKKRIVDASLGEFWEAETEEHIKTSEGIIGEKYIRDFLNVSIENRFGIRQGYPIFKLSMVCYFLPKLIEEQNFELVKLTAHDYDHSEISISRLQTEIDVDKTVNVVTYGDYFLTKNNKKFVVFVNFEGSNIIGHIHIYSSYENEKEASQIIADLELLIEKNNFLKGKKITPFGKFLKLKKTYSWDDVIFPKELEDEIKRNIEKYFENLSLYKENGLPTKRGILLSGSPGVGKTQLGKVLASTLEGITFIWVTPKYFKDCCGNSGVEILFDLANETSPAVLFMEDVDFYGTSREHGNNSTILGEFLNKIDGIVENEGVLIIMTTNYPEILDKAIKERPGRFDRIIQISFPGIEEREIMFKRFCKDLKTNGINWKKLCELTEGFTGALLKELIITASSFAIEDKSLDENNKVILKQKHFDIAFDTLKTYSKMKNKSISGFRKQSEEEYEETYNDNCCEKSLAPTVAERKSSYKDDTGVID